MPRINLPIAGAFNEARSTRLNGQRTVNWYPVASGGGAKDPVSLYPTPGLKRLGVAGRPACRGPGVVWRQRDGSEHAYMVYGRDLIQIDKNFRCTPVGALDSEVGRVVMATGRDAVLVADGDALYRYGLNSMDEVAFDKLNTDVAKPSHVTVIDHTAIINNRGTDVFYYSAILESETFTENEYATTEARPDELMGVVGTLRELWMMGSLTTEIFQGGDLDNPWIPLPGGALPVGVQARYSIAEAHGSIIFLGRSKDGANVVYMTEGHSTTMISDGDLNDALSRAVRTDDAFAWVYQHEGRTFYHLTLPTEDRTFVCELGTLSWHERKSYGVGRHKATGSVYFNQKLLVGIEGSGYLYEWARDQHADDGDPITRTRRLPPVSSDGHRMFWSRVEIQMETGVALASGQGSDPQIMLRWSDDGGKTWSNEHWRPLGPRGSYQARAVWNRLGSSRERAYEVAFSDPVEALVLAMNADVYGGE